MTEMRVWIWLGKQRHAKLQMKYAGVVFLPGAYLPVTIFHAVITQKYHVKLFGHCANLLRDQFTHALFYKNILSKDKNPI